MYYLSLTQIKDLNDYCKNRCQNILLNKDSDNIYYCRGQYKGYIYIIKLTHQLMAKNIKFKREELYNYIKVQKNNLLGKYHKEPSYIKGILDSFYDCLNFIST